MNNSVFKLKPKFKVNEKLADAIKLAAARLNIYNPDFDDDHQGGGYQGFKDLCLEKEQLPKTMNSYEFPDGYKMPGYFATRRLHPIIRNEALVAAQEIRRKFKIQL